jgi:hypothetical protein
MSLPRYAAALVLLLVPCVLPAADAEAELARVGQAHSSIERLVQAGKPSPEEIAAREDWILRRFPDTEAAARIELGRVKALFAAKKHEEALTAAAIFLKKFPLHPGKRPPVVQALAKVTTDNAAPAAARRKALDLLLDGCAGCAWSLHLTRSFLAGLDLSDAEKYLLARKGGEACGPFPLARQFVWTFLEKHARTAKPEEIIPECERFLARHGPDSAESVSAREMLLGLRAKGGDEAAKVELERFRGEQARLAAQAASLAADCAAAIKAGKMEEALKLAEGFRALPRRACDRPLWSDLEKATAAVSPELRAKAAVLAFDCMPMGPAAEALFQATLDSPAGSRPEVIEAALRWLRDHANDCQRDVTRAGLLVRRLADSRVEGSSRPRALSVAAEMCRKLGAGDDEAAFLWEMGRTCIDSDRPKALEALARAAALCPGSLPSARAAWLSAFLKGEIALSQPASPRLPSFLSKEEAPPSLALPLAPKAVADVVESQGAFRLRALDPKRNLLAGQAPLAAPVGDASLATDRNEKTAWQTGTTAASLVVPLAEVSTVARVAVKTTVPCGMVVALLDASGRPLGRFERLWNFWEPMVTPSLWPKETTEFRLLPVAGVAFVRVDLFEPLGAAVGVREIEAWASPFPTQAMQPREPQPLPAGVQALEVRWKVEEPSREVTHAADTESVRGFPVMRWQTPWKKSHGPIPLRTLGKNVALEFYGTSASLELAHSGRAEWNLDGSLRGVVQQKDEGKKKESVLHVLAAELPRGRHRLHLSEGVQQNGEEVEGEVPMYTSDLWFSSLKVHGLSRAAPAIRFAVAPGEWGEWFPLEKPEGSLVTVPARSAQYQVALVFDAREVLGGETATLRDLQVTPAPKGAASGVGAATRDPFADPPVLREELGEVARLLASRQVVVAYPKTGTVREYEAAKRLADRAGVYLVSDDIGLNLYPGLVLSVGRPVAHRYARQLLAMEQAWNSSEWLRREGGAVAVERQAGGKPPFLFVTGETVEAVERAAERLLAQVPARKVPPAPFHVFASDTLEMVYAWDLRPDRGVPGEIAVRLAANDRRSAQIGISANAALEGIEVSCSPLRSAKGDLLPPARVRPVGFYEWVPFFGDLRLPNVLLEEPQISLPANSACGVWLTFSSAKDAKPGAYTGEVIFSGRGHSVKVPVRVVVEPFALPDFPVAKTYSFAGVPYWFHLGTTAGDEALRALARNEAAHGVNVVTPRFPLAVEAGETARAPFLARFDALDRQLQVFEEEYRKLGFAPPAFLCQTPDLRPADRDFFREGGNLPKKAARLFAGQFAAHLAKTGRADRFYVKVADEPRDLAQWTDAARAFREGGLRTMTCHNGNATNLAVAVGVMDPWCPNYQHDVLRPFFRERQAAGEAVWWYCCGVPVTRLTGEPTENLPFYWLTGKWKFDGAMNYAAMHSGDYSMPVPFRYEHGMDHRILFLEDGRVLDTTRRELEGEGIRDLKLIEGIRARAKQARDAGKKAEGEALEASLERVLDSVVPYKYGYPTGPGPWHAARGKLYDLASGGTVP